MSQEKAQEAAHVVEDHVKQVGELVRGAQCSDEGVNANRSE